MLIKVNSVQLNKLHHWFDLWLQEKAVVRYVLKKL